MSLTNNTSSATKEVGIIIRLATQAEPTYADVKDKIGFLQRSLLKEQTRKVYTAMHYSTKDSLKTATTGISASDALSAGTAYKAYIFAIATETMITSVTFSTEAVPPIGSPKWIDNTVLNDPLKFTLSIPSEARINAQLGETLILPLYNRFSYSRTLGISGLSLTRTVQSASRVVVSCTFIIGNCTPGVSGYAATDSEVFAGNSKYLLSIFAIGSINTTNDVILMQIRDSNRGRSYSLTLTTD